MSNIDLSNSYLGLNAGYQNTTGRENTYLGYTSGINSTTTGQSTFIGSMSSQTSGQTYTKSTAIGYASNISASNQIVLGTTSEYVLVPGQAQSTSTTTGALRILGGLGVSGDIYCTNISSTGASYQHVLTSATAQAVAAWYSLGTFRATNTVNGGGKTCKVVFTGHNGYNARTIQNYEAVIYFKTSNGTDVNATGFAADSNYTMYGPNTSDITPVWVADVSGVNASSYTLYVYLPGYPNNSMFTVHTTAGSTWTDNIAYVASFANTANNSTTLLATNSGITLTGSLYATSVNTLSDYRIKQNVRPIDAAFSVDGLRPVEYDFGDGRHDMGFIAHEVQEELPFLVNGTKDGEGIQSLNYIGMIALLVKEIQALKHDAQERDARERDEMKKLRDEMKQLRESIEDIYDILNVTRVYTSEDLK